MPYARRRRLKRNRIARARLLDPDRSLRLVFVPPPDVPLVWEMVSDYIEEAAYYGEATPEWMKICCMRGDMQLWVAWSDGRCEGAGVTHLINAPEGLTCLLTCMSCDDFERCRAELAPQWEKWARSCGCVKMRINGRPGWERLMRNHGYKHHWVIIDKRLDNGFLEHH